MLSLLVCGGVWSSNVMNKFMQDPGCCVFSQVKHSVSSCK